MSQIKPRLSQSTADLRHKIKAPMLPLINKSIVQLMKKPTDQPKVPVPKTSRIHDKIVTIPACIILHTRSSDD